MSIGLYIVQASRRLLAEGYSELEANLAPFPISDVPLLLSLYYQPGLAAAMLTARLGRDKTTLSRSIARLTSEGLVQSEIDPTDGRRRNLYLTQTGTRITRLMVSRIEEETERLTAEMEEQDLEAIEIFLRRMTGSE